MPASTHQAKQSSHLAPRDEPGAWQSQKPQEGLTQRRKGAKFRRASESFAPLRLCVRSKTRPKSPTLAKSATASWSAVAKMRGRSLASSTPLSSDSNHSIPSSALDGGVAPRLATALHDAAAKIIPQILFVALGTALICLSSCDKKPAEAPQAAKPATESPKVSWRDWIAKSTDTDWWQEQWSEASAAAKASLEALKGNEVKKRVSELSTALGSKDFIKTENLAAELGKHLSLDKFEQGVRFIILQRKDGGEAALKAINDYAARTDLNEFEKAAAQNLQKTAAFLQRDDFRGWTYAAIFFACECKLGAHRGGLLAIPIISILFPDYLEKHGTKP